MPLQNILILVRMSAGMFRDNVKKFTAYVNAALQTANAGARFYKGKVGLRDIKRVAAAASYPSD
ncbi:MAG TPA: hypothetical protein VGC27_02410 [Rhizomicrobium sp.]